MSLIEAMMDDVVLLEKDRVPDGEGGFIPTWRDGLTFKAAITSDTTLQAKVAEKQGVTALYTITTKRSVKLEYHDVIRRGDEIFRVTSNGRDKVSPAISSLDMAQVSAERWELPNE